MVVVVPFIFRILVHYETFIITRAHGPLIVIAKEDILIVVK